MQVKKAVRVMATCAGTNLSRISVELGKHPTFIGALMNKSKDGGMNTNTVTKIASVCGYKLMLVPCDSPSIDGALEITE